MPHRVAALITGKRSAWGVIVLALILIGLVMSLGIGTREATSTDSLPRGYDSTNAAELREKLPEQDGTQALVLFTADEGTIERSALPDLAQAAGVEGRDTVVPSEDGTAAIAIIPIETTSSSQIRDAVRDLRAQLDDRTPDGISAEVTGPAGITADLAAVFDGADTRLLLSTASIVAVLLIITYRSPVLWIIPLLVIGIGDRAATIVATQVLQLLGMSWDESTTGILSVLVFGAGTNYALLLISRYRDALRATPDRRAALADALTKTFEPVFASATTVIVGVFCLLLSLTPTTRGLGLASAIGIVIAVLSALTVLPAVLSLFGRWVFWPKVPRAGQAMLGDGKSLWRRIGNAVSRRPSTFVGVAVALLAVASVGIFSVRLGLPESEQFLDTPGSIVAAERLAESFPAGAADPAVIVTRANPQEVTTIAEGIEGVESIRQTASGGGVSELSAVLSSPPDSDDAESTLIALRSALSGLDDTHVGGSTAQSADVGAGATRDRLLILPLILGLVFGALIAVLRSLVAPLVLVTTVVATYVAAIGISWWIFTTIFGFSALDHSTPLYAFLFLVALGVDYNIFLVTRATEEARAYGTREGMLRALAATGGVITSAGILLAAVFAVLGVLPLVVLAQIGVVICIGVLLDTLLVRTVVVPAITLILGDRFWWPRPAS